jgi:SAM-dependent methyltransferase
MVGFMKNHPVRGSLNSWFLDRLEDFMDRKYGARKRAVFRNLPQQVVEIGPGPGANLRYYPSGTRVIAVEPNRSMHGRLLHNAERYGLSVDIRGTRGEEIDLDSGSVAAVVGTLVLCTVEDPQKVISEILRILEPGGRYIFFEHVAAPPGSRIRSLQDVLHKPWQWLGEGCKLNRNTQSVLWEAGFSSVDMDCFMLNSLVVMVAPHIFGVAVK